MGLTRRWPGSGCGRALATAGITLALAATSGCIFTTPAEYVRNGFKLGPAYHAPAAPVADGWIQADDPRIHPQYVADWWRVFHDPVLDSLVESAYRQNLNLRVLGARVLQARAQQAIAVGSIFPQTQTVSGGYSRTALSKTIANNPAAIGAALGPTIAAAGVTPPGFNPLFGNWYSQFGYGFNLNWEADFWGRFRRSIESADANLDASVDNLDAALVTLLADVATNYVQYRVAQQRIRIARENVRVQESVLALVEQQFKVGINKVTELDVDQAKTVLEQTRSTIPALEIVQGQANDVLCILLGVPPHNLEPELGPAPELDTNPLPLMPDWVAAGIPADLLRRRPDIRSAERQVAAQSAQIGVAEADLYPAIFVNGTIGLESENLTALFRKQSFLGTITPNFRWNILNYGRIANNVRLQQARTDELVLSYQNQVLTAAQQVQTALRGFLRSQEQADHLSRSVKAAVAASQVGVKQYRAGTVPFNTVFNLEITQVQQQDQLAIAQGSIALNLIAAYRALGGGWELRQTDGSCPVVEASSAPGAR